MKALTALICFLIATPAAFAAEKIHSSEWNRSWAVGLGSETPRACGRHALYDLRRTAEEDALSKCEATSGKRCVSLGSYVLFNGVARTEAQHRMLGFEPNPWGGFGIVYAGCVAKGTAKEIP